MEILAGDIGGTKTRLALFSMEGGKPEILAEEEYPSGEYDSLEGMTESFRQRHEFVCDRACFGVAGPVRNRRCRTTNLPWVVDAGKMEQRLGMRRVSLINDLEATAWGIACLEEKELLTLQPGGSDPLGNRCLIAAGTGLGEAGIYWDGERHQPFATEGGHTDFAPRDELEFALLKRLQRIHGRVSWERILSGPGLVALYDFLLEYRNGRESKAIREARDEDRAPAAISAAALEGRCSLCAEALTLFVTLYGVETGNLALKQMASGGVYIGGGIAPKLLPKLREGDFLRAFNAKGRMAPLMRAMPVKVILDDRTALYGAALYDRERVTLSLQR